MSLSPVAAGTDLLCLTMNPSVDLATETPEVVPTHKLRCSPTAHDAGGGGINVARTVVRLGGPCVALCPAGGPTGDWLRRRLAEEGISSRFVPSAEDTRVSFTVHEGRSGQEYRFVMPGPRLSDAEWRACLHELDAMARAELKRAALEYHEFPTPGKLAIAATKQLTNQRDLALAYSPGVAAALRRNRGRPEQRLQVHQPRQPGGRHHQRHRRAGPGRHRPAGAKPVMEGKAVLFKKFSGIDVFDIEINEKDPDKLVDIIAALEPTFGGINLEDIKAPDCFYVERKLRERMKIPVFHDDQHGTAIVVGAAMLNGLKVVGKDPKKVKLVTSGAGAAALACLGLLVKLGIPRENIWVTDLAGVVYEGRTELMDEDKIRLRAKDRRAHPARGD
jgi:hypothetical protein